MDEAKRLGEVLPAITATGTAEVDQPGQTRGLNSLMRLDLKMIPDRLTDQQLDKLKTYASIRIPDAEPCPRHKFFELMTSLRSAMPSQNRTPEADRMQAEMYFRQLSSFTFQQIHDMVDAAARECEFFPTIARCLEILTGIPARNELAEKQRKVRERIFREYNLRRFETQEAFDTAMRRIANGQCDQSEVDAMPEPWKLAAVGYGYLRPPNDGVFEIRPMPIPAAKTDEETEA